MNFTGNFLKLAGEVGKKSAGGCLVSLLTITLCAIGTGAGIQNILSSVQTNKPITVNKKPYAEKQKQ